MGLQSLGCIVFVAGASCFVLLRGCGLPARCRCMPAPPHACPESTTPRAAAAARARRRRAAAAARSADPALYPRQPIQAPTHGFASSRVPHGHAATETARQTGGTPRGNSTPNSAKKSQQISRTIRRAHFSAKCFAVTRNMALVPQTHCPFGCCATCRQNEAAKSQKPSDSAKQIGEIQKPNNAAKSAKFGRRIGGGGGVGGCTRRGRPGTVRCRGQSQQPALGPSGSASFRPGAGRLPQQSLSRTPAGGWGTRGPPRQKAGRRSAVSGHAHAFHGGRV